MAEEVQQKRGLSKTWKWILGLTGGLIAVILLVGTGVFFGWRFGSRFTAARAFYGMPGPGMLFNDNWGWYGHGPGMMGRWGNWDNGGRGFYGGPGMMGGWDQWDDDERGFYGGPGMMGRWGDWDDGERGFYGGPGMMGGWQAGPGGAYGMMGPGMMYQWSVPEGVPALSVEDATAAIEEYLADLGNDDLELHEVMVFDNHAYAEIVEKSTGIGAMEVLVHPLSMAVLPEPGPNMMWNLKYGHMAGYGGMMGPGQGMMGPGFNQGDLPDVSADMPVSAEQAVELAQDFLDANQSGLTAGEAEAFYGYYTLHTLRDGDVVGMLSVNGYSGDVFPHTWHGELITMSEVHE